MSEIAVAGLTGVTSNVRVYDLFESIKASKYSFSTNTDSVDSFVTKTVKRLGSSDIGCGEDNFLNGIRVAFDLTLSNKAWVEAERYHFFDFVSSQSTMHCALKFNLSKQCNSYVDKRIIDIVQEKIDKYNAMLEIIKRDGENETIRAEMNELYLDILYNIPSGFQLTARMTTNYRQLKTIYYQRKNHRLPEWREFCKWMELLPMFDAIVLGGDDIEQS